MLNFHILTYSTDVNNQNLNLLIKNLNVTMLPILTQWTWDFYPKSLSIYESLKSYNKEDIVLVCDAHDVLPMKGVDNKILFDKIKECFDLDKITFNAEKNCYPNKGLKDLYPNVESEWKYLNAGIYVGKVKNILKMLEELLPKIKNDMDQNIFSISYVNSNYGIEIDYMCEVFQTMFMISLDDLKIVDDKVHNTKTNTTPLLFHGNGKSSFNSIKESLCV